ncbi:MAG TPA: hypothetical protein VM032_07000 [Vicinamibacterales bacterium]|nr:hypothetical protein [Vicinamibacterales bacterium]
MVNTETILQVHGIEPFTSTVVEPAGLLVLKINDKVRGDVVPWDASFCPRHPRVNGAGADRKAAAGYAARLLLPVSVGALSAVFVFEMLLGRFILAGADLSTAVSLLHTFQASAIFGALGPGLIAFFVGAALVVVPLLFAASPFRWPRPDQTSGRRKERK